MLWRLRRRPISAPYSNALLCVYAILAAWAVAQTALQLYTAALNRRQIYFSYYTRGSKFLSKADPRYTPGVSGDAAFSVNELGLRGPSTKILAGRAKVYRLITIGGSTTECPFLDDSETWPQLLMNELNRRQQHRFVFVGNTGVKGHTTAEHLQFLRTLEVLKQADMLMFLPGINDLITTLAFEGASSAAELAARAAGISKPVLLLRQPDQYPLYRRLLTVRVADVLRVRLGISKTPFTAEILDDLRRLRARGPVLPLPDLRVGLAEYRQRLTQIMNWCRSSGRLCVFLTQPTMWRAGMSPDEERLLWFGKLGKAEQPKGYVSTIELARAIDLYNRTLVDACRENGMICYDLAGAIPKDTSAFFDDCHFTEHGATLVARFLAARLLSLPAFQSP